MGKVVLPTIYFSSYLNRWHDVAFHLDGNMLWQDGEEEPLQLLVLVLHLKARGDAVARVQERASLPFLCQVVDEDTDEVDGDEDDDVGDDGLPLGHQVELRVEHHDTDDGVDTGEQETVRYRHPCSTK